MLDADISFINPFDKALFEATGKGDLDIMDFVLSLPIYYCVQPFTSYPIRSLKDADIDTCEIDENMFIELNVFGYATIKNQVESAKYIFELSKNVDKINEGFFSENEIDVNVIITCIVLSLKIRCAEMFHYLAQNHTKDLPDIVNYIRETSDGEQNIFVHNVLNDIGL